MRGSQPKDGHLIQSLGILVVRQNLVRGWTELLSGLRWAVPAANPGPSRSTGVGPGFEWAQHEPPQAAGEQRHDLVLREGPGRAGGPRPGTIARVGSPCLMSQRTGTTARHDDAMACCVPPPERWFQPTTCGSEAAQPPRHVSAHLRHAVPPSSSIDPRDRRLLLGDLERSRATYVLDLAPSGFHRWDRFPLTTFPELLDVVRREYERVGVVRGVVIHRRRGCDAGDGSRIE
jgi:hypothetical protein